jgi:hypothetical protein
MVTACLWEKPEYLVAFGQNNRAQPENSEMMGIDSSAAEKGIIPSPLPVFQIAQQMRSSQA